MPINNTHTGDNMSGNGVITDDWESTLKRHDCEIREIQRYVAAQTERDVFMDRRLSNLESANAWLMRLGWGTLLGIAATLIITLLK